MKTLNHNLNKKLMIAHKSSSRERSVMVTNETPTILREHINNSKTQKILLKGKNEHLVIQVNQILYIQSNGNYCNVILSDGRRYLVSHNLRNLVEKYALPFIRCHQSYVVNPEYILAITNDKELRLKNEDRIPISRRKYSEVMAYFRNSFK